ncbi:MAG: phosphate/phosphite/phosphonate ABC transporter substrate-binding protein [Nitrospirae bacterium]|nr:phosphate/phosphite/phosphonate ABC transporter substrate-binding protein [Nitrospirota bacterium]
MMKARHYMTFLLIMAAVMVWPLRAWGDTEILIGLIPEENIFNQMDRHRPLAAYLSKKVGATVRFTILSRYGDVMDRFVSRKMDGAFFGVFTGVLAIDRIDAEPIARPVGLSGSSIVQSYIFVRNDSGIRDVNDMKGKRIVFVDRATVTGYLYALSYLREHGVASPETYFREVSFAGSHGSTIYAVLDGRADIGTVKSTIFQKLVAKDPVIKEELSIIARSRELPDTTLFLRKDLPQSLRAKIKAALLAMDREPEGVNVLKKLEAQKFIDAKKEDFAAFYDIARTAGISVKTYKYR